MKDLSHLEKKETTTGCTSRQPDSNGSISTTSDGLRDSDDVCGCCCVPELSDEELERVKKHLAENPSPYVGKLYEGQGVSPMVGPTGLIWALRAQERANTNKG